MRPLALLQCVMCFRTAAAQQMERARILNFGILIMLIPPVLILAGFLLLAWRRNKTYGHSEELEKPVTRSQVGQAVSPAESLSISS